MAESIHRGNGLIAIVDDDPDVRTSTSCLLRAAGYRVLAFTCGEEFLQVARRTDFACVVLDLHMTGKSGLDVLRSLRECDDLTPVLVVTGQADVADAVAAMKIGAVDLVEKPCPSANLLEIIDAASSRWKELRTRRAAQIAAEAAIVSLPPRLRQVFTGIILGKPNKAIAHELGLSVRTVEAYRASAFERLNIRGSAEAVRLAMSAKWHLTAARPDRNPSPS